MKKQKPYPRIYEALESQEARRALLSGVVSQIIVKGREVVDLELAPGFEYRRLGV